LAKVQRKVVKLGNRRGLSTGMTLVILGGAVIVVMVLAWLLWPKPKVVVAGDPQGLVMCGNVPCPTKGDPNAPVKMIEVSDYGCSHCRDYNLNTESTLEEQYIKTGKVYYVGHVFGFQPQTQAVAAAALCANDQNKFWEYHAVLFRNQGSFDSPSLFAYAQQVGLDTQAFANCVSSGKYRSAVEASSNAAMNAGVEGTPSFFINGKLVAGNVPLAEFQARLDEAAKTGK
jgi:protein-disulfide isomerase